MSILKDSWDLNGDGDEDEHGGIQIFVIFCVVYLECQE